MLLAVPPCLCGEKFLREQPDELREQPEARGDRSQEEREQAEHDDGEEEPVAQAAGPGLFGRNGGALLQKLDVHLVRLPRRVEDVADEGHGAEQVVHRDVRRHPQQRHLRHAVAHARREDVERDGRRREVADAGDEPDQRVQADAPTRARDAEEPVHRAAQLVEAPLHVRALGLLGQRRTRPALRHALAQSHRQALLTQTALKKSPPPFSAAAPSRGKLDAPPTPTVVRKVRPCSASKFRPRPPAFRETRPAVDPFRRRSSRVRAKGEGKSTRVIIAAVPRRSLMSFKSKHVFFAAFGLMTLFVFYFYETAFLDSQSPVWQHVEPVKWLLLVHGVAGAVALLVAPFQFSARLRRRYPRMHRVMGRLYVAGAVISAPRAAPVTVR